MGPRVMPRSRHRGCWDYKRVEAAEADVGSVDQMAKDWFAFPEKDTEIDATKSGIEARVSSMKTQHRQISSNMSLATRHNAFLAKIAKLEPYHGSDCNRYSVHEHTIQKNYHTFSYVAAFHFATRCYEWGNL